METTCHYGSTGLSLLPWPCPGHINPSDRIARTCPSFWVSIYTTWQSLWPSLTQGNKKGSFGTVRHLDETEYFWSFVFLHTWFDLKINTLAWQQKVYKLFKFRCMSEMLLQGFISKQGTPNLKQASRARRKTWRVWWERTLTLESLGVLTSAFDLPQYVSTGNSITLQPTFKCFLFDRKFHITLWDQI